MMRVGVLGHGFIEWGGGVDFLRTVIGSLLHAPEPVAIHLLLPTQGPRFAARAVLARVYRSTRGFVGRPLPEAGGVRPSHLEDLVQAFGPAMQVHRIDWGHAAVARAARELELDAVLPAITPLPTGLPVPWVGYVYDFQHRYLPELFAPGERRRRDQAFARLLAGARAVIVNSRAVAADVERFHGAANARVFALPFSAAPQPQWLGPLEDARQVYGLERPYFIVCNQFWKHKDHATAFAAFARLAKRTPDVDLVCTGPTTDYRDESYFPALQRQLAAAGLIHRVHILGMVPKLRQIALLREATALIQPTLFEGGPGGGAVFDAVSLGVPCLVSDIPVNAELSEPAITFFRAGDPDALSNALRTHLTRPAPPRPAAALLLEQGLRRREQCGAELLRAIRAAGR